MRREFVDLRRRRFVGQRAFVLDRRVLSDWEEFDLLKEAVDLVQNEEYRGARRAFHSEMLRFVRDQQTDCDSVKSALEAMEVQLQQLAKLARSRKRWV